MEFSVTLEPKITYLKCQTRVEIILYLKWSSLFLLINGKMEELISKLKLILKFVIALEKKQSDPYLEMSDQGESNFEPKTVQLIA